MRARFLASCGRARLMQFADWAAIAVAVMLPWSTSATAIAIAVWLMALVPTFDAAIIRESFAKSAGEKSAGELPVLLWAVAVVGMLWAGVGWSERVAAAAGFTKLLAIPLLLAQFYRSNAGKWVLFGFLASATALLLLSWCLVLLPGLPWRGRSLGVPVKDYLAQSGIFVICAFVLLHYALQMRERYFAMSLLVLAGMFVGSLGYVATARTAITVFTVLLFLFGTWHFGWKGIVGSLVALALIGSLLWSSSGYFRSQILGTVEGTQRIGTDYISISTGLRLEIWSKSIELIMQAPLIGHGTGAIPHSLGAGAQEPSVAGPVAAFNPHNEIFRIGIQTGLLGIAVLIAMWISHLMLFRNAGSIGWIGTVIVTQNIVSSMFNSHLADFTQAWLYAFGVGVAGGMVLRQRASSDGGPLDRHKKMALLRS
jgi:O-antigen ligase